MDIYNFVTTRLDKRSRVSTKTNLLNRKKTVQKGFEKRSVFFHGDLLILNLLIN